MVCGAGQRPFVACSGEWYCVVDGSVLCSGVLAVCSSGSFVGLCFWGCWRVSRVFFGPMCCDDVCGRVRGSSLVVGLAPRGASFFS